MLWMVVHTPAEKRAPRQANQWTWLHVRWLPLGQSATLLLCQKHSPGKECLSLKIGQFPEVCLHQHISLPGSLGTGQLIKLSPPGAPITHSCFPDQRAQGMLASGHMSGASCQTLRVKRESASSAWKPGRPSRKD